MNVKLKANAKLNLTLNVEGMFDDTFHKLSSVVVTVNIYDTVSVSPRQDKNVNVFIGGEIDKRNVANKVASAIVESFDTNGVDIVVEKGITIMGGMGGSSVDAAATICAMANMYDLPIDTKMIKLATQYGSDIAYMICGGLALASGKGDDVMFVSNDKVFDFVVITGSKMSTTAVFSEYDKQPDLTRFDNTQVLEALATHDIDRARKYLGNDLQASALRLSPEMANIINVCNQHNIPTPTMTGSGGNFFILCKNDKEAKNFVNKLTLNGLEAVACQSTYTGMETL